MLTLNVHGNSGEYNLNIPTSINEITEEYINSVTHHVKVAPNYALIGTIFREKLSTIILATRSRKKDSSIPVIPIFIKAGETTDDFIKSLNVRDKIVISPSDIMMGYHISTPRNLLTINTLLDVIEGDTNIFQKTRELTDYCYFIEFKLVPVCNIHGAYEQPEIASYVNPFVTKLSDKSKSNIIV